MAVLEQQIQALRASLEAALGERKEALETAQMTAAALKEVEAAHQQARLERDEAREEAEAARASGQEQRLELQYMLDEAQLEIHRLETERKEMVTLAAKTPTQEEPGEALITALVDIDAMRSAHEAAMARAKRTERELRKKASHITTNQERILRHLRAEVVSLTNVFEAAGN